MYKPVGSKKGSRNEDHRQSPIETWQCRGGGSDSAATVYHQELVLAGTNHGAAPPPGLLSGYLTPPSPRSTGFGLLVTASPVCSSATAAESLL